MSFTTKVTTNSSEKTWGEKSPSIQRKSIPKCATLLALVVFVLIDLVCLYGARLYNERKYKNCEALINAYQNAKHKPDIVILGSSLMRLPFYLCDIEHSYYAPEPEDYCWNHILQNILNNEGRNRDVVFDFAIDGSMVSDVFLIRKKFLSGANAPRWIVYGIAPRDLLDNLLSKETRTPLFDRLFDLKDIWLSKSVFNMSLQEKLDLTLEKLCIIYGIRSNIQQSTINLFHDISENGFSRGQNKKITDTSTMQEEASNKNLRVYEKRYKTFQFEKFDRQKLFLKALCEGSTKNGTRVLLVNMPLTQDIVKLIPAEASSAYNSTLTETAKLPDVFLLDLQNSKKFSRDCFGDLVHLNGKGGHFLSILISRVLLTADHKQSGAFVQKDCSKQIINTPGYKNTNILDGLTSWWLAKAYFAEPKPPDIVIWGGSQLGALLGADAYVYDRLVDFAGDYRSHTTEHDLKVLLHKQWHVFIGALPGSLISDQLIASRALFPTSYKPKLVVVTLSPKDFIDKSICSATTTEPFTFFSKYADFGNDSSLFHDNAALRPSIRGGINATSWRKILQTTSLENYDRLASSVEYCPRVSPLTSTTPYERICPGELVIHSGDGYSFYDNTQEYKKRYRNPFSPQLNMQLHCLDSLFKYLRQRHIATIAIELPLTTGNHLLLPENFWKFYRKKVTEICQKNGADYWDTESIWGCSKSEFCDSAHLNLVGGLRQTRSIVLAAAYKLHLPMYAYNGNAGQLVPGKEKIYFHKSWTGVLNN